MQNNIMFSNSGWVDINNNFKNILKSKGLYMLGL